MACIPHLEPEGFDMVKRFFNGLVVVLLATCLGACSSAPVEDSPADGGMQGADDQRGETPITGAQVADGTYDIVVDSSSSMFNPVSCELIVDDGVMTAVLTLHGDGYEKLYMGTAEEAPSAPQTEWCLWSDDDGDGRYSYTVPVEYLDSGISCAAYSFRRERWYDRTLVFESANIPADAISS